MSRFQSFTVGLGWGVVVALGSCPGAATAATAVGAVGETQDAQLKPQSDGLRAAAADTATTAQVKKRLATDKRFENSKISVTTTNGIVTLTGRAPTHEIASAAEDVASSVSGVKGVDNQISAPSALEAAAGKVSQGAKTVEHEASDDWITTKIKGQLLADRSVERGSDINVKTSDGVVTLSGTASSRDALDHARDIARNVKGVKSVDASGLRLASAQ
jgi:hyperosmotically inducible periplasmic protein